MKRLSVRLSIVGAVLALGGAAIAYSLLAKSGDAPAEEKGPVAENLGEQAPQPPAPIRGDGGAEPAETKALKPPPATAFERNNDQHSTLRTVSHESAPASDDEPDAASAGNSADMIPSAEPDSERTAYGTGFPVAAPTYGTSPPSTAPPAESEGTGSTSLANSTGDVTSPSANQPPAATGYGSGFPVSAVPQPPTTTAADDANEGPPGAATPTDTASATTYPVAAAGSEHPTAAGDPRAIQPPSSGNFPTADNNAATGVASHGPTGNSSPTATAGTASQFSPASSNTTDAAATAPTDSVVTRLSPSGEAAASGLRSNEHVHSGDTTTTDGTATAAATNTAAAANRSYPATPAASGNGGSLSGDSSTFNASRAALSAANTPATDGYAAAAPSPYSGAPASNAGSAVGGYAAGSVPPAYPSTASPAYPSTNSTGAAGTAYSSAAVGVASPASADASTANLVSDMPGDQQLEGQQSPAILIEKSAPDEIQVNRTATFQLRVRNAGNAPAHNVVVVDRVPRGTQFVDALPRATPTADGMLAWQIDTVKPGEEVVLSMNVIPQVAGEIGSVAQATFQAQASVRTICTKPELKLNVTAPPEILIGQPATLEITVTNSGNGAAENVTIEEDVPEGFTHAAGRALEHVIGTLQPQQSRRLTLPLNSVKPGTFENHLTVRGEGKLFDEDVRKISVTSPQLQLAMQGPSLRYLDRQATFAVHLANPGTAAAKNVELVTYLPKGMKYVTSDNQGQYDSQSHAVYWSLEELPPDKQGDVHFTVLPIEPGNHKLKADGRADLGLKQVCEHEVAVEGLAELAFTVSDVADPIEVGSETAYEVRIQNRGSKADTNIQLVTDLPTGITPTTGDGPTRGAVQGQRVVFAPLAQLGPNEEAIYKIHARGVATGDHVIRVQVQSADLSVPVTKEEITRVYSDK